MCSENFVMPNFLLDSAAFSLSQFSILISSRSRARLLWSEAICIVLSQVTVVIGGIIPISADLRQCSVRGIFMCNYSFYEIYQDTDVLRGRLDDEVSCLRHV